MNNRTERGYLEEDFRVFYLNDVPRSIIPTHYHDFYKIVMLIDGSIDYMIEGRHYAMRTGDIMLVGAGKMHRPILAGTYAYERLIIYLSARFFEKNKGLDDIFTQASLTSKWLLAFPVAIRQKLIGSGMELRDTVCKKSSYAALLQQSRLVEFLIELNEKAQALPGGTEKHVIYNKNVQTVLKYINDHLTDDLSMASIAEAVHLNESYLMHLFRSETGTTIREYVSEKRLFLTGYHLERGCTASEACRLGGFTSYSSFFRAFKQKYGISPGRYSGRGFSVGETPAE